jgi:hypothetical protein
MMSTSLTGKPVDLDGERIKPRELASEKLLEPTRRPRHQVPVRHCALHLDHMYVEGAVAKELLRAAIANTAVMWTQRHPATIFRRLDPSLRKEVGTRALTSTSRLVQACRPLA